MKIHVLHWINAGVALALLATIGITMLAVGSRSEDGRGAGKTGSASTRVVPAPPEPQEHASPERGPEVDSKASGPVPPVESPAERSRVLWNRLKEALRRDPGPGIAEGVRRLEELERLTKELASLGPDAILVIESAYADPDADLETKKRALTVAGRIGDPRAMALVLGAIRSPGDVAIRLAASECLSGFRDPAVAEALREVLAAEPSFPGRYRLVVALAATHRAEVAPILVSLMDEGDDGESRRHAADGLSGYLGESGVRDALLRAAGGDSDTFVRLAALRALSTSPDPALVEFAASRMPVETDAGIRAILRRIQGIADPQ